MEFEKKNNIYRIAMIIIVTALITFLLTTTIIYNYYMKTNKGNVEILTKYITQSDEENNNLIQAKMELLKSYLNEYYVGEIDEENMIESAIKGYVNGLNDMYTEYLTQEEYEDLLISVNGSYTGVGIYMAQSATGEVIVLLPIEGSPAEEADIRTGDIITKVNGEDCKNMDMNLVAAKIKGEEGTKVKIEISRDEQILEKELIRKKVEIKYIYSEILENNIGYIQLLSFDEKCTEKFEEHLKSLQSQGAETLIVDLRSNGGGMVDEAIMMSELFLEADSIIMKSYNKENEEKIIKSGNNNPNEIEMVILVDENSASATEIFTAAMQDNNRAKVIGEKTFGKGVMQQLFPLRTGGVIKITIEKFKTPNGNEINEVGITPDIEIEQVEDIEEDIQLEKAIDILK